MAGLSIGMHDYIADQFFTDSCPAICLIFDKGPLNSVMDEFPIDPHVITRHAMRSEALLKTAPDLQTTEVGQLLGIDQTTATRKLALMRKSKLLADSTGADRRERRWHLTQLGETTYRRLLPKWESAQAMIERRLGRAEAIALKKYAFNAASALSAADENLSK